MHNRTPMDNLIALPVDSVHMFDKRIPKRIVFSPMLLMKQTFENGYPCPCLTEFEERNPSNIPLHSRQIRIETGERLLILGIFLHCLSSRDKKSLDEFVALNHRNGDVVGGVHLLRFLNFTGFVRPSIRESLPLDTLERNRSAGNIGNAEFRTVVHTEIELREIAV